jgi:hypothetical protein
LVNVPNLILLDTCLSGIIEGFLFHLYSSFHVGYKWVLTIVSMSCDKF